MSITNVLTTTDDDHNTIAIYPSGWLWAPVGSIPMGAPPSPTNNPNPSSHDVDGGDDDDDDDGDECSTTEPPECTKTISYLPSGSSWTTTELGDCPQTTGCVSGTQNTTKTTISSTVVVAIATLEPDDPGPLDALESTDGETVQFFLDSFENAGISLHLDEELGGDSPSCVGDLAGFSDNCFKAIYPTFCSEVNENPSEKLRRSLVSGDMVGNKKRTPPPDDTACDNWHVNFHWSGSIGKCSQSCSDAMDTIAASCAPTGPAGVFRNGSLDIGCGKYEYIILGDGEDSTLSPSTSTTTELPPATTTATPPPTYEGGTCNAHIRESGMKNEKKFYAEITLYDNVGTTISNKDIDTDDDIHKYGETITVDSDVLSYSVNFEFINGQVKRKRDKPVPAGELLPEYFGYDIGITAGDTVWLTEDRDVGTLPHCEVGDWDTHNTWDPNQIIDDLIEGTPQPTRDMDYRWAC
ncbi:hypothetical protein F5Y15DRAFT_222029 [Xylariaceae sp. FL0016]|nr:hypothetical protein F5Y15DRAFT_222029 [Xylariaceae sp. FL0016]